MQNAISLKRSGPLFVLVIDESPILATALSREIGSAPEMSEATVTSLTWDKLEEVGTLRPDIVVLDLDRAEGGPEAFITRLRRLCPKVLLLSFGSMLSADVSRRCLQLGVRAFLPRSADVPKLIQALVVVARNGLYLDADYRDIILESVMVLAPVADQLSARENVVLRKLAAGQSHKQAAAELGLSHKTIETYKSRGMAKLGLKNRNDLLRHALAEGWLD